MVTIGPKELRLVRGERSLLEDIPEAQRAAIAARTSTYDIRSALVAAQAAVGAGGTLVLPKGKYRLASAPSSFLAGQKWIGAGGDGETEIEVPAGATFAPVYIDGVSGCQVRGIKFSKASGAALSGSAYAVYVRGDANDTLIEDVTADAYVRGVQIAGGEGTVAGTCRRVTLRNVTANNSPSSFGINVDDCDTLMLDNCSGRGNWLDGVKLRKRTTNVTIVGGAYTGNGLSWLSNPAYNGNGIDAFAGGDTFVIVGTNFDGNYGSGCYIKAAGFNSDDEIDPGTGLAYPLGWGYIKDIQLIGLRCRDNLVGSGLEINQNTVGGATEPIVGHVSVLGGLFTGNSANGVYVRGRHVALVAPQVHDNQQHGIYVATGAFDVTITDPHVAGNSRASAGGYVGIEIAGAHVTVRGGAVLGVSASYVPDEAALAALTVYHLHNIRVAASASDVTIDNVRCQYRTGTADIISAMASGVCLIHQRNTGSPSSTGAYGSTGSTYVRTDPSASAVTWEKVSGAPNAQTTGWVARATRPPTTTVTLDFPSIAAGAVAELTVAEGCAVGDMPLIGPPAALEAGLLWSALVTATDTVTIRLYNATASPIDPASASWRVSVIKQ